MGPGLFILIILPSMHTAGLLSLELSKLCLLWIVDGSSHINMVNWSFFTFAEGKLGDKDSSLLRQSQSGSCECSWLAYTWRHCLESEIGGRDWKESSLVKKKKIFPLCSLGLRKSFPPLSPSLYLITIFLLGGGMLNTSLVLSSYPWLCAQEWLLLGFKGMYMCWRFKPRSQLLRSKQVH